MANYIWALYDPATGMFGPGGKLVYQKRANGLFYDNSTHKPLKPQPKAYSDQRKKLGRPVAAKHCKEVPYG